MQTIDLRSDTVTKPTSRMLEAMAGAEVGDDVYQEDPTVRRLEDRAAEMLGKEAALFVPTGTMGNQVAIQIHTRPGQEVLVDERSHVFNYEMAMVGAFAGCQSRPFRSDTGHPTWKQLEALLSPETYYYAPTGLVVIENTHNFAGGTVLSPAECEELAARIHARRIPVHLDGARIFNAAAALNCSPAAIAGPFDSVMFCLSKGLSAPIGSLILGSREFIDEAWRVRKMLGGGMRQVGYMAAAGLVALEDMPSQLGCDHEKAKLLAALLNEIRGFSVAVERVVSNIVLVDLDAANATEVIEALKAAGVLAGLSNPRQLRFVTHKDVSRADISRAAETASEVFF